MTEVAFHVNVSDPMDHACRLVRKGYLLGLKMLVVGDAGTRTVPGGGVLLLTGCLVGKMA